MGQLVSPYFGVNPWIVKAGYPLCHLYIMATFLVGNNKMRIISPYTMEKNDKMSIKFSMILVTSTSI